MDIKSKLRAQIRSGVLDILGYFSTPSPGVHILSGHYISHDGDIDPVCFDKMLEELSKKVKFIRFEEAVRMIVNKETPTEPLVAFDFDDGFEEVYTQCIPILEKYGTNAAVFVNPNFAEGNDEYIKWFTNVPMHTDGKRPIRWEQLKELDQRGHIIGAHTMDHFMINSDDEKELYHQIVDCKKVIEEKLGHKCEYFAFPYGRLDQANEKSIEMAIKHYPYVFSQSDHRHYFSYKGKVINRRHFEPCWPEKHVVYFISCKKKYE